MCSCDKKVKRPEEPYQQFTLNQPGNGSRVTIASRAYVKMVVNNRLYVLKGGETAPMFDFEAQALIDQGAPIWTLH